MSTSPEGLALKHLEVTRQMYEIMGYDKLAPTVHFYKEGHDDIYQVIPRKRDRLDALMDAVRPIVLLLPWTPDAVVLMMDAYEEYEGTEISCVVLADGINILATQEYDYSPDAGWKWGRVEIVTFRNEDAPIVWKDDVITTRERA